MPVAHGHKTVSIDTLPAQFGLKRPRLPFRVPPDRRTAADGGVVVLPFARARSRNQLGKRLASDAGEREVNNVRVAEKVVQKRFDRFQRVGSAQLKEDYPHNPWCARHFPQYPQNAAMYSEPSARVNGGLWISGEDVAPVRSNVLKKSEAAMQSGIHARVAGHRRLHQRPRTTHRRPTAAASAAGESVFAANGAATAG